MRKVRSAVAVAATSLALVAAACGDGGDGGGGRPRVVVTTNILGDVVAGAVGEVADVTTVMPVGASPHDFQASARQTAEMRDADLLVVNGAGFEDGLLDVIDGVEDDGVPVHEAISTVETLDLGGAGSEVDPHFFTDPRRMEAAVRGIVDALVAEVPDVDEEALRSSADEYLALLADVDADVEAELARIGEARRVLVTNHEVFGYFADRYGFEVVGTVIPAGSTSEGAGAGDLAELAEVVEERQVPAVFADTSSPDELARTLAREVGDVEVVELFSESLGDEGSGGDTYVDVVRTNARRIAGALG